MSTVRNRMTVPAPRRYFHYFGAPRRRAAHVAGRRLLYFVPCRRRYAFLEFNRKVSTISRFYLKQLLASGAGIHSIEFLF